MRCRDDPDIDLSRVVLADTDDLALLEYTQQFNLGGRGDLDDFIEQQDSPLGRLEAPDLRRRGPGKGAA